MQSLNKGSRERAYRAGAAIARERMAREAPLDARALEAVEASDLLVVPGQYDRVQQVLEALEMPFTTVQPAELATVRLHPEQLLVVNCPGTGLDRSIEAIRGFVRSGGSLFTTDWALRHVLEPAFPGTVAFNERPTRDDVVRIEVLDHDNPFLHGVMDEGDDPQWWLEGSSYPIRILDPARVQVLIQSAELGERYGERPVAVLIHEGQGEVFHMISHYYLQRTELRNRRHAQPATDYAYDKGVDIAAPLLADMTVGDVESASSSARVIANVVAAKKRRSMRGE